MIRNFKMISILALVVGFAAYCGEKKSDDVVNTDEPAGEVQEGAASDLGDAPEEATVAEASKDTTVETKTDSVDETPVEEVVKESTSETVTMTSANAKKVLSACTSCHYLDKGSKNVKNGMGPGLKGVYNSKPTNPAIQVSAWNTSNLNKWLSNPKDIYKRSRMNYRISDKAKRATVIEALKLL